MDIYKDNYRGSPKIEYFPEREQFRVIFYKFNKQKDWATRVTGKAFATKEEGGLWANKIILMARTEEPSFYDLSWEDQKPILERIIKFSSSEELEKNWEQRTK